MSTDTGPPAWANVVAGVDPPTEAPPLLPPVDKEPPHDDMAVARGPVEDSTEA